MSPRIFDTVSLMSGGFPAEFGNRFGGILDVTTRSGRSLDGSGTATLGFGTVENRDGSADYGGSADRWGYYVYGGAFHSRLSGLPTGVDAAQFSSAGLAGPEVNGEPLMTATSIDDADIRQLARQLCELFGSAPGTDLNDWLQAKLGLCGACKDPGISEASLFPLGEWLFAQGTRVNLLLNGIEEIEGLARDDTDEPVTIWHPWRSPSATTRSRVRHVGAPSRRRADS